jgi:hypothetical protein
MDFVLWTVGRAKGSCHLDTIEGFNDDQHIHAGKPVLANYPPDAFFKMKDTYPNNKTLHDLLINLNCFLIVSDRLKAALTELGVKDVEYLPVAIKDHDDEVVGHYFVLNARAQVPMLDRDASGAFVLEGTDIINGIKSLVLDERAAASAPSLFRISGVHEYIVVRKSLAEALESKGFTNLRWIKPEAIANGESFGAIDGLDDTENATL